LSDPSRACERVHQPYGGFLLRTAGLSQHQLRGRPVPVLHKCVTKIEGVSSIAKFRLPMKIFVFPFEFFDPAELRDRAQLNSPCFFSFDIHRCEIANGSTADSSCHSLNRYTSPFPLFFLRRKISINFFDEKLSFFEKFKWVLSLSI